MRSVNMINIRNIGKRYCGENIEWEEAMV